MIIRTKKPCLRFENLGVYNITRCPWFWDDHATQTYSVNDWWHWAIGRVKVGCLSRMHHMTLSVEILFADVAVSCFSLAVDDNVAGVFLLLLRSWAALALGQRVTLRRYIVLCTKWDGPMARCQKREPRFPLPSSPFCLNLDVVANRFNLPNY